MAEGVSAAADGGAPGEEAAPISKADMAECPLQELARNVACTR